MSLRYPGCGNFGTAVLATLLVAAGTQPTVVVAHGMMTHPPTRFPNAGPDFAGMDPVGSVFCELSTTHKHDVASPSSYVWVDAAGSWFPAAAIGIMYATAAAAGFNQGCSPGCASCSYDACDKYTKNGATSCCEEPMEPTLNCSSRTELSPRTFNDSQVDSSGSATDGRFRYHPWRSPGYAPVGDPWFVRCHTTRF